MGFFNSLNVSASGLTAQTLRMDVLSQNIANIDTTRTADGGPYKRKTVLFQERGYTGFEQYLDLAMTANAQGYGVRVTDIVEDQSEGQMVYDPQHPDANADGYYEKPNVNIVEEMVNLISASRSYEANITAIGVSKAMMAKTLEISR